MNEKPLVSIIIPNYNNAVKLVKALNSCIQQTYKNIEIIVVDDHSSDNSLEVIHQYETRYPEIKSFNNPKKGANEARQFGFQQSKGEIIQWLDSDDEIMPDKITTQLPALMGGVDVVYSDFYLDLYIDQLTPQRELFKKKTYNDFLYEILNDNWSPPHNYLFKRDIVSKVIKLNGWNPETKVMQDREFITVTAISGATFRYVPGVYSIYNRWKKDSISMKYSHKERIKQSVVLNQHFYELILKNISEPNKQNEYIKLLNTEIVRNLYYYPAMKIPRKIPVNQVKWTLIDKKIWPIVSFLLLVKNNQR